MPFLTFAGWELLQVSLGSGSSRRNRLALTSGRVGMLTGGWSYELGLDSRVLCTPGAYHLLSAAPQCGGGSEGRVGMLSLVNVSICPRCLRPGGLMDWAACHYSFRCLFHFHRSVSGAYSFALKTTTNININI